MSCIIDGDGEDENARSKPKPKRSQQCKSNMIAWPKVILEGWKCVHGGCRWVWWACAMIRVSGGIDTRVSSQYFESLKLGREERNLGDKWAGGDGKCYGGQCEIFLGKVGDIWDISIFCGLLLMIFLDIVSVVEAWGDFSWENGKSAATCLGISWLMQGWGGEVYLPATSYTFTL